MYGHAICNIMKKDHQGEKRSQKEQHINRKNLHEKLWGRQGSGGGGRQRHISYILKLSCRQASTGQCESLRSYFPSCDPSDRHPQDTLLWRLQTIPCSHPASFLLTPHTYHQTGPSPWAISVAFQLHSVLSPLICESFIHGRTRTPFLGCSSGLTSSSIQIF